MDGGDPRAAGVDRRWPGRSFALIENRALACRDHTGRQFDQRGFPRSIFSNQRMDFSGGDLKTDRTQRLDARELLRYGLKFKNRIHAFR